MKKCWQKIQVLRALNAVKFGEIFAIIENYSKEKFLINAKKQNR